MPSGRNRRQGTGLCGRTYRTQEGAAPVVPSLRFVSLPCPVRMPGGAGQQLEADVPVSLREPEVVWAQYPHDPCERVEGHVLPWVAYPRDNRWVCSHGGSEFRCADGSLVHHGGHVLYELRMYPSLYPLDLFVFLACIPFAHDLVQKTFRTAPCPRLRPIRHVPVSFLSRIRILMRYGASRTFFRRKRAGAAGVFRAVPSAWGACRHLESADGRIASSFGEKIP